MEPEWRLVTEDFSDRVRLAILPIDHDSLQFWTDMCVDESIKILLSARLAFSARLVWSDWKAGRAIVSRVCTVLHSTERMSFRDYTLICAETYARVCVRIRRRVSVNQARNR